MFREAAGLELAPDLGAVDLHVEDPSGPFDQLHVGGKTALDRIRQTGGLWQVVSLAAVFDRHSHDGLSPEHKHTGANRNRAVAIVRYEKFIVMRNSALVRILPN